MKPLNSKNKSCDPISSDCVIWDGRSLDCISLCKGDSVSNVVYKLATELCKIMDSLNISDYDLSCLNLASCEPNIKDLLEYLIKKVCEIEGLLTSPVEEGGSNNCPTDCIVTVNDCLIQLGGPTTPETMKFLDYIDLIATTLCKAVRDITLLTSSIVDLDDRVTVLENSVESIFNPSIISQCIIKSNTDVKTLLTALENAFCTLEDKVGDSIKLTSAINTQCDISTLDQLSGNGQMTSLSGWVDNPSTVADTITNAWLTICDIRSAVQNILDTCCQPASCKDLILNPILSYLPGSPTGQFKVIINGTIPSGFIENSIGTSFTFSDGSVNQTYNDIVTANINNSTGLTFTTAGLNITSDITLTMSYNFTKPDGNVCNGQKVITIPQPAACPTISFTPGTTNVGISFVWPASSNVTVSVYEISDLVNAVNIKTFTGVIANSTLTHSFTGLNPNTQYAFVIQPVGGEPCAAQMSTTLALPCVKPLAIINTIFTPTLT